MQATLGDNVLFAVVQNAHRLSQHVATHRHLIIALIIACLIGILILQPILPLCRAFAVAADHDIQRGIAPRHPAVHRLHFGFSHAQISRDAGNLFGPQVPNIISTNPRFRLAKIEKQLLLSGRGSHFHQGPRAQHIFLNARPDPPHRICGQAEAFFRVKLLDGLHQADIGLRDDLRLRQPIATIAHGDFSRQTQVARHQLMRRTAVLPLHPSLGQHILLFRLQHWEFADILHIAVQSPIRRWCR